MRLGATRAFRLAATIVVLASASDLEGSQNAATRLPQRLESYLSNVVRPTAAERKQLMSGNPITKTARR